MATLLELIKQILTPLLVDWGKRTIARHQRKLDKAKKRLNKLNGKENHK